MSRARREGSRLHPIMGFMCSELMFSVYLDCDESENVWSKFRTLIFIGSRWNFEWASGAKRCLHYKITLNPCANHPFERNLSKPFFFLQDVKGNIAQVYFPHDDQPELVGLKKGIFLILSFEFIFNSGHLIIQVILIHGKGLGLAVW